MDISTSLSYYKIPLVRKAIAKYAEDKEVSVRFANGGFGKRPDIISYENDVFELAKKKVTSFHCSEELWFNPLSIVTGMKRHELNELRQGWDLILDIDCPDWEFSKLTTHLFIQALKDHGVESISVKFSGNKGFHIGVPFEAFPESIHFEGEKTLVKDLFPEGPRKIAIYLLHYITSSYTKVNEGLKKITFLDKYKFTYDQLEEIAKKSSNELFQTICPDCKKEKKTTGGVRRIYQCSSCNHLSKPKGNPDVIRCESCGYPVEQKVLAPTCAHCGSKKDTIKQLNFDAVVDVDTVLIASRHLYRMPYSLHEKSSLVSIPIKTEDVLSFDKEQAKIENLSFEVEFLERSKAKQSEAVTLFVQSFDHNYDPNKKKWTPLQKIEVPENAISETHFPPCINNILGGLEDGKKRALFILINFLQSVGWSSDQIESFIYEWNERNPEPLKEQYLKGQLSQIKRGKEILPPPSCANQDYYKSLLICTPDAFCSKIKNPSAYTKRKHALEANKTKKKPKAKTETKVKIKAETKNKSKGLCPK